MSDEKQQVDEESPEVSPSEVPARGGNFSKPVPAVLVMGFLAIALVGVLIVTLMQGKGGLSSLAESDIAALQAEVDARRAELNRQRVAFGLNPLVGGSEPLEDIADRLKKDTDTLVSLAAKFQELLGEKDTQLIASNAEILRSEKLRQSLAAEASRLQKELQRALVNGSDAELLRREMLSIKEQRDAFAAELSSLREQMKSMSAGASADDYADLKRRYDEAVRAKEFFQARVQELESDLSQAKLFARSENELLPAAVALFRALRELEGHPDSDMTSAYSRLGVDLGANVLHTLTFATGSAELTASDSEMIRNLVDELPDGDLLLVIGYASETGNIDKNQQLSSDRATAVAEAYSEVKRPGQLVQAVYLGQTDRFSSRIPERNQLCEIWRIRQK
jgi:outer membrane protein OmpA-like peptidoglycan-associated protein/molybdopterin converting factor small subunit